MSTLFYSQARPSSPSQNPTAPAYLHSSEALYASTHLSNAPHILMNCALKEIHNLCRSCLKTSESHKVERSLIFNMHWCKETWRCTMTNRSWGTVLGSLLLFLANVLYLLDGLRCLEKTNTAKQNEFKMGYKVSKTTDFSKLSRRWFIQVLTSPEKKKHQSLLVSASWPSPPPAWLLPRLCSGWQPQLQPHPPAFASHLPLPPRSLFSCVSLIISKLLGVFVLENSLK